MWWTKILSLVPRPQSLDSISSVIPSRQQSAFLQERGNRSSFRSSSFLERRWTRSFKDYPPEDHTASSDDFAKTPRHNHKSSISRRGARSAKDDRSPAGLDSIEEWVRNKWQNLQNGLDSWTTSSTERASGGAQKILTDLASSFVQKIPKNSAGAAEGQTTKKNDGDYDHDQFIKRLQKDHILPPDDVLHQQTPFLDQEVKPQKSWDWDYDPPQVVEVSQGISSVDVGGSYQRRYFSRRIGEFWCCVKCGSEL